MMGHRVMAGPLVHRVMPPTGEPREYVGCKPMHSLELPARAWRVAFVQYNGNLELWWVADRSGFEAVKRFYDRELGFEAVVHSTMVPIVV